MSSDRAPTRRVDRIAFLSSGTPEADAAVARLAARHGAYEPEQADLIVALGGDGLMLQTLHRFMGSSKPVYGMNRGSVGFLMNEYAEEGLIERLRAAQSSTIHPLIMRAVGADGATSVRVKLGIKSAVDLNALLEAPSTFI